MDDEGANTFFIMGQPTNSEITTSLLFEFAHLGDAEAQFQLAETLHLGKGVPKDVEAALIWYKSAAEQGHVLAQNDYGSMLLDGIGCPPNPKEAVIWYRKAAMQGNSTAQFNLALRYLHGTGIEVDDKEAVLWLTLAMKQGHVEATGQLGTQFRFGRGASQDFLMAAELHIVAAKSGDGVSHGNLADYRGDLETLALDGSATASLALVKIYEGGLGTDADPPLALAWVRWADTLTRGPWEPSQLEERDTLRVKVEAALDAAGKVEAAQQLDHLKSRARQGDDGDLAINCQSQSEQGS